MRPGAALLGVLLAGSAPVDAGKDETPAFRVASVTYQAGAPLDGEIRGACDVAQVVTGAIQQEKNNGRTPIDLSERIDRVVRLRGSLSPGPMPGGTELGITLLSAGTKALDQPFLCRKYARLNITPAAHCARIEKCSETIAKQISAWLRRR